MKKYLNCTDASALITGIRTSCGEVGMLELGKRAGFPIGDGFTEIGCFECDSLAVEQKSKEVVMLDHEVSGRVMAPVAKDIFHFVRAVAHVEAFFIECKKDEALYDDDAMMKAVAREATSMAGGDRYAVLYNMIFGV